MNTVVHLAFFSQNQNGVAFYERILTRFQELYQAAGKPKGDALYVMRESIPTGRPFAFCLPLNTATAFPALLAEAKWEARDEWPGNAQWVAGDEKLKTQLAVPGDDEDTSS